MIVNRRTYVVKRGCRQKATALLKTEVERVKAQQEVVRLVRVLTPNYAPNDTLVLEWEYESLAECEAGWAEWEASPEAAAFMEKWNTLIDPGGTNEIWTVV